MASKWYVGHARDLEGWAVYRSTPMGREVIAHTYEHAAAEHIYMALHEYDRKLDALQARKDKQ